MRRALFVIGLAFCVPVQAQDAGNRINLVCLGGGAANKTTSTQAYARDSNGNSSTANVIGNRSVPFDDQVNLWIEAGDGRLRMPRSMLPTIHGGDGGWFKIKSIKVTDSEITGSVAVNFINNPKLRIDRYTGAISISGKAGDFIGRCEKYDPAETERAF